MVRPACARPCPPALLPEEGRHTDGTKRGLAVTGRTKESKGEGEASTSRGSGRSSRAFPPSRSTLMADRKGVRRVANSCERGSQEETLSDADEKPRRPCTEGNAAEWAASAGRLPRGLHVGCEACPPGGDTAFFLPLHTPLGEVSSPGLILTRAYACCSVLEQTQVGVRQLLFSFSKPRWLRQSLSRVG